MSVNNLISKQLYPLGDSIYLLSDNGTWDAAQTEAQSYGGNLVTINNAEEQILLAGLFANISPWIGYNDSETEGTFEWVSGENSTYTNWDGDPPIDADRDFVYLSSNFSTWDDWPGNDSLRGIIEITNPSTPIFIIEDLGIIEPANGIEQAIFTVRRYGNTDGSVTIDYSSQDFTAFAGVHYQSVSGQLVFDSGETEKTIAVNIFNDGETDASGEIFYLNLTSISGNGVLGDNQAVATIRETSEAVTFGGKTYILTNPKNLSTNWGQAEVEARTYGGNLVTINDAKEQIFLAGLYADISPWIGYSDAASEGQWAWITDPTAYNNWDGGKAPVDADRDFAYLTSNFSTWDDWPGSNSLRGIIEINSSLSIPFSDLTTQTVFTLGDSIYLLTPEAGNWGQGQVTAQNYQGNLVTINNAEEQIFLAGLYADISPWIGYSDAASEGQWTWISDTSDYNNWDGDGNPPVDADRDFAYLSSNLSAWNDWPGSNPLRGIIEIKNPNTPLFIVEDLGIIEPTSGSKQAFFTVKRYGNTNTSVTINYTTQDDTARAGIDYQSVNGQLIFNEGETTKTITVNIFNDADTITAEKFFLNLTSISGNGLLGDAQAVGTIRESTDVMTFGGNTYLLTEMPTNWGKAQAEARTYGGNLVTINDSDENSFLTGNYGNLSPWIGYSDAASEGEWKWITDPTAYNNWAGGNPPVDADRDFAYLNSSGSWNDWPGSNSLPGIIEIKAQTPVFVPIESLGNTSLVKDNQNRFFAQTGNNSPIAVKDWSGNQIYSGKYPGWEPVAVETINGENQVVWKNQGQNKLYLWRTDNNWKFISGEGEWGFNSREAKTLEDNFQMDFNGDNVIGLTYIDGDINGDGKGDILWRNHANGDNYIWYSGDSNTGVPLTSVTDLDWKMAGESDINGDGQGDILWRNDANGDNYVWYSGNSSTGAPLTSVTDLNWKMIGGGDINGDGIGDILWRNQTTGSNVVWYSGDSSTSGALTSVPDLNWKMTGGSDINGDGKGDILWRNQTTGSNVVWYSGDNSTSGALTSVPDLNWKMIGGSDINGDGIGDILWRNEANGQNAVWYSGDSSMRGSLTSVTDLNWNMIA